MASISDIISRSGTYEGLIQQLVQLEGLKKVQLEADKSDQVKIDKELGTISSKISTLENNLKEFSLLENKTFTSLTTQSSDNSIISILSSSDLEEENDFSITVDRLATKDHLISTKYNLSGTELNTLGSGSVDVTIGDTTKTFTINSGSTGSEKTNKQILDEFASEMESQFGNKIQANVFQTKEGEIQMSIKSNVAGYDSRIQTTSTTGFFSSFFSESTKQIPESELNSLFSIDGIEFERSNNVINDAIDGLSFELLKTTKQSSNTSTLIIEEIDEDVNPGVINQLGSLLNDQNTMSNNPVQISIKKDTEKATSNFNSFMEAFNDLNKTIRSRTFINAETGSKGPLQGIRSIRNLSLNLRQIALIDANPGESTVRNLTELGVGFDKDGTMKIENQELFDGILTNTPEQLDQFFAATSSSLTGMKNILNTYTESGGVIDSLETGVEQKTERLNTRIAREEKYLLEYEDQQRAIFARLEQLTEQGMSQYNQVMMSLSNSGISR